MKNKKEIGIAILFSYLITSYFEIPFPDTAFWTMAAISAAIFLVIRFYWRKINLDILD